MCSEQLAVSRERGLRKTASLEEPRLSFRASKTFGHTRILNRLLVFDLFISVVLRIIRVTSGQLCSIQLAIFESDRFRSITFH